MSEALESVSDARPRRFRSYPVYRDSGVEWLGEIPAHWESKRLKHLCARAALYGANEPAESYAIDGVRFLRTSDILDNGELTPDGAVFLPPEIVTDYMLQDGDLLLSRSGTLGRAFLYREQMHGACAYAGYLVRFVPRSELVGRFGFYFTKSRPFLQWLSMSVIQSTIGNINGQKYANLYLPVPPVEEQSAVVAFLDRETAKIDALVAKKERLTELLQGKGTALITRAVTRGLDPNVPMKDSDVEWLGEIPAHWEVKPLRRVFSVRSGEALPHTEFELNPSEALGVPVIGGNGVMGYTNRSNIESPCLAIGRVGALCGNVHPVDPPAWVTDNALLASDIKGLERQYLRLALDCLDLNRWASQSAQPLITGGFVKAQRICAPPMDEQRRIVKALEAEIAPLDGLILKIREGIDRLREFRTALISAAVTGKIDVREEAV